MLITKTIEIDMGHRVPNHASKCKNPHGHRYVIEVGVDDKVITTVGASDEGMVIDFGTLKQMMMDVIDAGFDHGFVLSENDPYAALFRELWKDKLRVIYVPFIPTAENLAKHWFELLVNRLAEKEIKLRYVKVWETPSSTALYQP